MDLGLALALAGSGLLSLACLVHLWRGEGGLGPKLLWSAVAAAPFVGPILYATFHDPPPPADPADRSSDAAPDESPSARPPDWP